MDQPTSPSTVTVGPQGRLVIPSDIRREMGIGPGDVLLAFVESQRLVLEKREAVLRRLLQRFERVPAEVSLADELIAERRSEGRREEKGCARKPLREHRSTRGTLRRSWRCCMPSREGTSSKGSCRLP